jgi:hypothetical protein
MSLKIQTRTILNAERVKPSIRKLKKIFVFFEIRKDRNLLFNLKIKKRGFYAEDNDILARLILHVLNSRACDRGLD